MDILFEAEARDVDPVAIVEDRIELSARPQPDVAPIAEYTREIVTGAATELDRIDDTIEKHLAADWELHRLPAVDRAILRVSTWELLFNPDVPAGTAVVEGVEMASEYSNDVAAPYIHAMMDAVAGVVDKLRAEINADATPAPEADESAPDETAAVAHDPAPAESSDAGDPPGTEKRD